jgi:hypothetical protein
MSDLSDARHMLEGAERAAIDGDFPSADALLRDAARIQEAELGPFHPDLVNTLNNLAILAEKRGRPGEAETFYRRAAAIASTSLPSDHPIVTESRHNLEDFCRERGLPLDAASVATPLAPNAEPEPNAVVAASQPPEPAARRSSHQRAWVAAGAIVLVAVAVLVRRPSPSGDVSLPAETAAPQATESAPLPVPAVTPAPIEQAQPPKMARQRSSASATGALSLTAAQLCENFSTSGRNWRCDPPGDPAAQGTLVLYTRVRSPQDAAVVHRWYREDKLQRAVKLRTRANELEGFRTYSRQRLDGGGNWRVEVRSADGDLLHEQRFAVR